MIELTTYKDSKNTWIRDRNGNRCSVEQFGSEDLARTALLTLENCVDCVDCAHCSNCVNCANCTHCAGCVRCAHCHRCKDCTNCTGCNNCQRCSRCAACPQCTDCTRCYLCSRCDNCVDCSDCQSSRYCTRCVNCVECGDCLGCKNLKRAYKETNPIPPRVPVIADLHAKIYAAASRPRALDMHNWHTCDNTHCRAGWAIALAGGDGENLEYGLGPVVAAMKIYDASCPGYEINPCRFFDDNESALADMRSLAEASK